MSQIMKQCLAELGSTSSILNGSQGSPQRIAFNVKTDPSKGQAVLPKVLTGSTNLDELGGLEQLFCCVLNHFADLCGSRDRFGDSMTQAAPLI